MTKTFLEREPNLTIVVGPYGRLTLEMYTAVLETRHRVSVSVMNHFDELNSRSILLFSSQVAS